MMSNFLKVVNGDDGTPKEVLSKLLGPSHVQNIFQARRKLGEVTGRKPNAGIIDGEFVVYFPEQ
jgi:hypothetical protein